MNFYKLLNKFAEYKKSILSLGIIFIILIFSNKLLLKDVVYESDDYKLHAVRIANYYLALKQGQFPVRWGPNLNGSYGYPAFNYMYHTPYVMGALIHSLGFSVQESLNFSVLVSIVFGSLCCYLFVASYIKQEIWRILLTLFFIFNPYTLLNIYWRGAIGELYFYALVPLFLLSVKKMLENETNQVYFYLIIFSTSFLVLSHLPSMILLALLTTFFIYYESNKKIVIKKLLPIFYACILGLFLSSWYLIPAYFEQWMVNYKNSGSLLQYLTQFVKPMSLFDITKSSRSSNLFIPVLHIGGVSFLSLIISIFLFKLKKSTLWLLVIFISIIFTSQYTEFLWNHFKIIQYIQYPWRFLWLINIAAIMIYIEFILNINISIRTKNLVMIFVAIGILFSARSYIISKGTTSRTDFDWYHPTYETGSSFNEHLPIWAKTSYNFPKELLYVNASESAKLTSSNLNQYVHDFNELNPIITKLDGTSINYTINKLNKEVVVLHKRLYYPGWVATNNKDEKNERIAFKTDIPEYNGILALSLNGYSNIEIQFTGFTKLRRVSEAVSILSFIFIVGQLVFKQYRIKKQ